MSKEANDQLIYGLVANDEKASIVGSIAELDFCMLCGKPSTETKTVVAGSFGDVNGKRHHSYLVYGSCSAHSEGAEISRDNLIGRSVQVEVGPLTDAPAAALRRLIRRS